MCSLLEYLLQLRWHVYRPLIDMWRPEMHIETMELHCALTVTGTGQIAEALRTLVGRNLHELHAKDPTHDDSILMRMNLQGRALEAIDL